MDFCIHDDSDSANFIKLPLNCFKPRSGIGLPGFNRTNINKLKQNNVTTAKQLFFMYLFLGKDSFLENLKTFGINIKESDNKLN